MFCTIERMQRRKTGLIVLKSGKNIAQSQNYAFLCGRKPLCAVRKGGENKENSNSKQYTPIETRLR